MANRYKQTVYKTAFLHPTTISTILSIRLLLLSIIIPTMRRILHLAASRKRVSSTNAIVPSPFASHRFFSLGTSARGREEGLQDKGSTFIPVIDFNRFPSLDAQNNGQTAGAAAGADEVVSAIHGACLHSGFFYLCNHGIASDEISEMMKQADLFFGQSDAVKQQYAWRDPEDNVGYQGANAEILNADAGGDPKETMNYGNQEVMNRFWSSCASSSSRTSKGSTAIVHSPEMAAFDRSCSRFFASCQNLSLRILQAFAIALQLDPTFFQRNHKHSYNTMRMLLYHHHHLKLQQQQQQQLQEGLFKPLLGEHSDWGSITILFQDSTGGLEVKHMNGEWVPAVPIPGTCLVNVGDLMQLWTNGLYRSTMHRVRHLGTTATTTTTSSSSASSLAPKPPSKSRKSIAYFVHPDPDTVIECLPTCITPDRPQSWSEKITSRQYLIRKLEAAHDSGY